MPPPGQSPDFAGFEGAPETLMDRVAAFLVSERHRLRGDISDRMMEAEFVDGKRDPGAPQVCERGEGGKGCHD